MSNFGKTDITPDLNIQHGAIHHSDAVDALRQVGYSLEQIGNAIGDVDGYGTSTEDSFKTSINSTIGSNSLVSIDVPLGVHFKDYQESFSSNDTSNDFVLQLIPDGSLSINDGSSTRYVLVSDRALNDNNEYTIIGRKLIFYKRPSNAFTVLYSGTYPKIDELGPTGYMPNVFPSPALIDNGKSDRPSITPSGNNMYDLEIKPSKTNSYDTAFSVKLDYALSEKYREFVSPTGGKLCPSEMISLWKRGGELFQKIDDADIYIISPSKFRFKTSMHIDPRNDIIVVGINNWSLADTVAALTKLALTHSHNTLDISMPISHGYMTGLRSERRDKSEQEFGISNIRGDDHPQYFHRDGYNPDNHGTFNNAITGDILLGSTDPFNLYNNITGDSRKLYFGSVSDAASLMFSSTEKYLKLYSKYNGLFINSKAKPSNEETSFGFAMNLDGHRLYARGATVRNPANELIIESKDGTTIFTSGKTPDTLATIKAADVHTDNISVKNDISLTDEGSGLIVGNISIKNNQGSVTVSEVDPDLDTEFKLVAPTLVSHMSIEKLYPKDLIVSTLSKIIFATNINEYGEADYLTTSSDGNPTFINKKPLNFEVSGKNTGISMKHSTYNRLFNIYSAATNGGPASPTDHNMYLEGGDGAFHFIKGTDKKQSEFGKEYQWGDSAESLDKRVDNLHHWPRASVFAGHGDLHSINLLPSSLRDRRGITFATHGSIYVTGDNTACPPGWMIIESKNGVVFIDSRGDATDCQTMTYSVVTTGDIQAFGDVSIDKSLGVTKDIDCAQSVNSSEINVGNVARIGSLDIRDQSRFNGSVLFSEDVTINTGLRVGGEITASSKIAANEIEVHSRTSLRGPVDISDSLTIYKDLSTKGDTVTQGNAQIGGRATIKDSLIENSTIYRLTTTEAIVADGGMIAKGKVHTDSGIASKGDIVSDESIKSARSVITKDVIGSGALSMDGKGFIGGDFQVVGDSILGQSDSKMIVGSESVFNNKKTSFMGITETIGEAFFKDDAVITGNVVCGSEFNVKGSTRLEGPVISTTSIDAQILRVQSTTMCMDDAMFSSNVLVDGYLSTEKGASLNGDVTVSSQGNTFVVQGDSQFVNDRNLFNGEVIVSKGLKGYGSAEFAGNATFMSSVTIEGRLNTQGSISTTSSITCGGITTNDQSTFRTGFKSSGISEMDTAIIKQDATVGGVVNTSSVNATEGYIAHPRSLSSIGALNVQSDLSQTDVNATVQFSGQVYMNNSLTINNDTTVEGSLMMGSGDDKGIISKNKIDLTGHTGLVKSRNIETSDIAGGEYRQVPYTASGKLRAQEMQAFKSTKFVKTPPVYVDGLQYINGDTMIAGTLYVGQLKTFSDQAGAIGSTIFNDNSSVLGIVAARAKYG